MPGGKRGGRGGGRHGGRGRSGHGRVSETKRVTQVVLNRTNAVLVHVTTVLPVSGSLISGIKNFRRPDGSGISYTEQREKLLAASLGRKTVHFSLSHVMPTHSNNEGNQDIMIIIPVCSLPDEIINKVLGAPEDEFLFTDGLSLRDLGVTLIVPKSREQECIKSGIQVALGPSANLVSYRPTKHEDLLSKLFIQYAQGKELPYLVPVAYHRPGDSSSAVVKYSVVQGDNKVELGIKKIHASVFGQSHFCMEHSMHMLSHLERYLVLMTEISFALRGGVLTSEIKASVKASFCYDSEQSDSPFKLYRSFECFVSEVQKFLRGEGKSLYCGNPMLYEAFTEAVNSFLCLSCDGPFFSFTDLVRQYHEAKDEIERRMIEERIAIKEEGDGAAPGEEEQVGGALGEFSGDERGEERVAGDEGSDQPPAPPGEGARGTISDGERGGDGSLEAHSDSEVNVDSHEGKVSEPTKKEPMSVVITTSSNRENPFLYGEDYIPIHMYKEYMLWLQEMEELRKEMLKELEQRHHGTSSSSFDASKWIDGPFSSYNDMGNSEPLGENATQAFADEGMRMSHDGGVSQISMIGNTGASLSW